LKIALWKRAIQKIQEKYDFLDFSKENTKRLSFFQKNKYNKDI